MKMRAMRVLSQGSRRADDDRGVLLGLVEILRLIEVRGMVIPNRFLYDTGLRVTSSSSSKM
jgi:hypothetical protein